MLDILVILLTEPCRCRRLRCTKFIWHVYLTCFCVQLLKLVDAHMQKKRKTLMRWSSYKLSNSSPVLTVRSPWHPQHQNPSSWDLAHPPHPHHWFPHPLHFPPALNLSHDFPHPGWKTWKKSSGTSRMYIRQQHRWHQNLSHHCRKSGDNSW